MKRFIFLLLVPIHVTVLAQTETTEWWVNGEVYATTSCEIGGDISVPEPPQKKGYTFQGWENATYDISTLDTSKSGYGHVYNGKKYRVSFAYGTIYGEWLCSSTTPSTASWYTTTPEELDTTTGSGGNCYCRIFEFIPSGSSKIYETPLTSWIYFLTYNTETLCSQGGNNCSYQCVSSLLSNSSKRAALYRAN